jgi:hypothetical protein
VAHWARSTSKTPTGVLGRSTSALVVNRCAPSRFTPPAPRFLTAVGTAASGPCRCVVTCVCGQANTLNTIPLLGRGPIIPFLDSVKQNPMTPPLPDVPVATWPGHSLTLAEFLRALKVHGRLEELVAEVIQAKLISAAAQALGIQASDEELQKAADTFRRRRRLFKAADTLAWLQHHHLTAEDLQALAEQQVVRQRLAENLTQGKVEQFFAENQLRFQRARLAQLVVPREEIAQELLSQIVDDGRDFAELCRKHSLDAALLAGCPNCNLETSLQL